MGEDYQSVIDGFAKRFPKVSKSPVGRPFAVYVWYHIDSKEQYNLTGGISMNTYYTVCFGTKNKKAYACVKSDAFKYKKDFASALKCRGLRFNFVWTHDELLKYAKFFEGKAIDLQTFLAEKGLA